MRIVIFGLAGLQFAAFVLTAFLGTGGSDAAGNAMSGGFVTIGGMILAVFLAPALILAINNKALKIGLGLSLVPPVLVFLARGVL